MKKSRLKWYTVYTYICLLGAVVCIVGVIGQLIQIYGASVMSQNEPGQRLWMPNLKYHGYAALAFLAVYVLMLCTFLAMRRHRKRVVHLICMQNAVLPLLMLVYIFVYRTFETEVMSVFAAAYDGSALSEFVNPGMVQAAAEKRIYQTTMGTAIVAGAIFVPLLLNSVYFYKRKEILR